METDVIEVEEQAPSIREALEEAFEEHDPTGQLAPVAEDQGSTATQVPVEPSAESKGDGSPGEVPKAQATPPQGDATQQPAAPAQPQAQPQPTATPINPPAQWKPAAKEVWNSLPRIAQEEIARRESDTMRLIGSVGPKIRIADEVAQHLAPFAERLSSVGIGPSAFIGDVFSSIKTLASGSPQERAAVVANIVQSYGVDVRELDAILTHRLNMPPEVHQAHLLAARANAILQQQHAGIEQQSASAANQALAAFAADPKHEFFGEVRTLMADLIDSGRANTLEDAYAAAIWANADTRKILLQREAQTRATGKTRRASAARMASASIHGTPSLPAPVTPNQGKQTLRESLEAAFDEHSPL